MALGELQLIRQELLRFQANCVSNLSGFSSAQHQQERQTRWTDSLNVSEQTQELCSAVNRVQARSMDRVFARQVLSLFGYTALQHARLVASNSAEPLIALQLVAFKPLVVCNDTGTTFCSTIHTSSRYASAFTGMATDVNKSSKSQTADADFTLVTNQSAVMAFWLP